MIPRMVEEWRKVALSGYEDHYEVSSLGRVRRSTGGMILKTGAHPKGYRSLVLSVGGQRKTVLVHHLVLTAFVGPRPEGMETRHLDRDRTNNRLSNLLWGTSAENEADKRRHGTAGRGDRNAMAKINEVQVLELRVRAAQGESQYSIARDLGISQPQVSRILSGTRRGPHPEG